MEPNLPSNSHKSKEEAAPMQPIVSGTVTTKKANVAKKISSNIFADDMSTIGKNILWNVALPNIRELFRQIGLSTVNAIFGGGGNLGNVSGYTPYNKISVSKDPRLVSNKDNYTPYNRPNAYTYDDFIFDSYDDANQVIMSLEERIDQYGTASVANLFEVCDKTPNYTDHKWIWTSLAGAKIEPVYGGGYRIRLPKPIPFKR